MTLIPSFFALSGILYTNRKDINAEQKEIEELKERLSVLEGLKAEIKKRGEANQRADKKQ